ncbi:MAG: DUF4159 domain-containing protein [Verrucomicrobiales bacterium]
MPSAPTSTLPAEGFDQIPTQPSVFKARVVALAVLALSVLAAAAWDWMPRAFAHFLSLNVSVDILFAKKHYTNAFGVAFQVIGVMGVLCAVAGVLGFWRQLWTYWLLRATMLGVALTMAGYAILAWIAAFAILDAELMVGGQKQNNATIIGLWWTTAAPALGILLYAIWLKVMLRSRSVHAAFTGRQGDPMSGDHVLEDLRTHGRDPRHRRSVYASAFTHLLVIVIIPYILTLGGCVTAYRVPPGSGEPVVAVVRVVKPQKKKKKTLNLRPNSAIIFETPDLDDTEVDRKMEQQTDLKYVADAANAAKAGKIGKGGGSKGGWPEGMEDYLIRFIRLEHSGAGWDDGMDLQSGADVNFLRSFAQVTGFKKIAAKGESHSIALLRKYPDDGFPPFVFLTGNESMPNPGDNDVRILREYCLKGGMLIGDAGSPRFHESFVGFMRRVFPDKPLIDIADDDIIYKQPYEFPNGAPAFWHHGGRRALGIKHEGRWIVFYHPGDMNDAWKSPGFTDVTPEMRAAAMNLGVNLVYYSFNQWNDAITRMKK